jgi:hypothetical protein
VRSFIPRERIDDPWRSWRREWEYRSTVNLDFEWRASSCATFSSGAIPDLDRFFAALPQAATENLALPSAAADPTTPSGEATDRFYETLDQGADRQLLEV